MYITKIGEIKQTEKIYNNKTNTLCTKKKIHTNYPSNVARTQIALKN